MAKGKKKGGGKKTKEAKASKDVITVVFERVSEIGSEVLGECVSSWKEISEDLERTYGNQITLGFEKPDGEAVDISTGFAVIAVIMDDQSNKILITEDMSENKIRSITRGLLPWPGPHDNAATYDYETYIKTLESKRNVKYDSARAVKERAIGSELIELNSERLRHESSIEGIKASLTAEKSKLAAIEAKISDCIIDLRDVRAGNWTPMLPFTDGDPETDPDFQVKPRIDKTDSEATALGKAAGKTEAETVVDALGDGEMSIPEPLQRSETYDSVMQHLRNRLKSGKGVTPGTLAKFHYGYASKVNKETVAPWLQHFCKLGLIEMAETSEARDELTTAYTVVKVD